VQIILNDNVSAQNVEVFLMLHHLKLREIELFVCLLCTTVVLYNIRFVLQSMNDNDAIISYYKDDRKRTSC
jgi:hypothetical protein